LNLLPEISVGNKIQKKNQPHSEPVKTWRQIWEKTRKDERGGSFNDSTYGFFTCECVWGSGLGGAKEVMSFIILVKGSARKKSRKTPNGRRD